MKKQQLKKVILTATLAGTSLAMLCSAFHTLDRKIENLESQTTELTSQMVEFTQSDRTSPAETTETPEPETVQSTHTPEATNQREKDIELIGRTIWGEAGGVESTAERAAVAWCILNRVDATGKTIEDVVTAPHQFYGYRTDGICPQEHLDLAEDVLSRWESEKLGTCASGRTLPAGYLYFTGDGSRNHFTKEWGSSETWTWVLPNPYK